VGGGGGAEKTYYVFCPEGEFVKCQVHLSVN